MSEDLHRTDFSGLVDGPINMNGLALTLPVLKAMLFLLEKYGRVAVNNCGPVDLFGLGIAIGLQKDKA